MNKIKLLDQVVSIGANAHNHTVKLVNKFGSRDSILFKQKEFSSSVPDFRRSNKGNIRHRLDDIIMLMILARASKCIGRTEIIEFGRESAIQQYQRAEAKLGGAVTTISQKVDTINQHIDKVLENAPTKLKVSVNVNDADWQKIQELFAKERQWMTAQMQMHIREVNSMFADERKKVRERYKEYDGCYLGHYAHLQALLLDEDAKVLQTMKTGSTKPPHCHIILPTGIKTR